MTESVAVAKEADAKKGVSPTRSDNSVHRVRNEPERQLGSLRGVIGNIRRDGGKPSVESIATELSSMHTAQRTPALLALQQTHGNRYVQRVVSGIQAKLKVGHPGDKYEQEADRVAEQVMRMPEPQVQRQCPEYEEGLQRQPVEEEEYMVQPKPIAGQITPLVQRQVEPEKEEKEEELIQAKIARDVTPEVTPATSSGIQSLQGGGQPLSGSEQSFFEPRFGADFSNVRVHNDTRAANVARSVNARAFTFGHNVVFGVGEYSPDTFAGRKLLAHELMHVVQQEYASQTTKRISRPEDASEVAAHRSADAIVANRPVMGPDKKGNSSESFVHTVPAIQCWDDPEQRSIVNSPPLPEEERELPAHYEPVTPRIVGEFDFGEDIHVVDPMLSELLDSSGSRGWHTYTRFPSGERWDALLGELARIVSETRADAAASTDPHASYVPHRSGLMYVSEEQAVWERTQSLANIGIASPTYRQSYLWAAFRFLLAGEGDSSSINTYDDQGVTWGHGFSARSRGVGRILNAVPESMREWLHQGGIHVFPDNQPGVLLLPNRWRSRPVVARGDLALARMRTDQGALNMLVGLAQSTHMTDGREERQWVLREQFIRFTERNGDLTEARLRSRPQEVVFAAILMKHWLGGTRQLPLLRASSIDEVILLTAQQHPSREADINSRRSHHRSRIRRAVADAAAELSLLE